MQMITAFYFIAFVRKHYIPEGLKKPSSDEPGIVVFRVLQSDAFVSKCNSNYSVQIFNLKRRPRELHLLTKASL